MNPGQEDEDGDGIGNLCDEDWLTLQGGMMMGGEMMGGEMTGGEEMMGGDAMGGEEMMGGDAMGGDAMGGEEMIGGNIMDGGMMGGAMTGGASNQILDTGGMDSMVNLNSDDLGGMNMDAENDSTSPSDEGCQTASNPLGHGWLLFILLILSHRCRSRSLLV